MSTNLSDAANLLTRLREALSESDRILRVGALVARLAHNQEANGSIPLPVTNLRQTKAQ